MANYIHQELIGMGAADALNWARKRGKHISFQANYAPVIPVPGRIYVEFGDDQLISNAYEIREGL